RRLGHPDYGSRGENYAAQVVDAMLPGAPYRVGGSYGPQLDPFVDQARALGQHEDAAEKGAKEFGSLAAEAFKNASIQGGRDLHTLDPTYGAFLGMGLTGNLSGASIRNKGGDELAKILSPDKTVDKNGFTISDITGKTNKLESRFLTRN